MESGLFLNEDDYEKTEAILPTLTSPIFAYESICFTYSILPNWFGIFWISPLLM